MDSGSFQATVPVPSNTPMGTYTVSIFTVRGIQRRFKAIFCLFMIDLMPWS